LAPRVQGEIVGPRRLSDAVVRPLNFTSKDFPVVSTVGGVLVR